MEYTNNSILIIHFKLVLFLSDNTSKITAMKYYSEVLKWDLWETYWRMMNKQKNCIKVWIRIIE